MTRLFVVAVIAVVGVLVWAGVARPADVLALCIDPGGNVTSAATCKKNDTPFTAVSAAQVGALEARVTDLEGKVSALEALVAGVTREEDTLLFSGMNLQVTNGAGSTDSANGLGNVILGYNAADPSDLRTGSHDLVVGDNHTYTSFAGVVSGVDNSLTGRYSFVSGAFENTASGFATFVGGGFANTASGSTSFVGGGAGNTARGPSSFVGSGTGNTADAFNSFVGGGARNTANGASSFIGGGAFNTAGGLGSFLGGGDGNTAADPSCGFVISTVFPGSCP